MPDSIEGREPTSRKARRQKQREEFKKQHQQIENPSRRLFLKGLGAVLLTAAAGGAYQIFGPKSHEQPRSTSTVVPTGGEATSIEQKDYRNRLIDLNNETYAAALKDPNKFKEIAPKISDLAVAFFCQEMDYDPIRYKGKLSFEWNNDYLKKRQDISTCIDTTTPDDEYAFTTGDSQEIFFNLTKHLYENVQNQTPLQDIAVVLFYTTLHELHHVSSPVISLDNQNGPPIKQRGLGLLLPRSAGNKPGFQCYGANRIQLEEAIVEHSTQKMLNKLAISTIAASSYKTWVERYQKGIVDELFRGDHTQLLKLHQQTNQDEFFRLIGQKVGVPPELEAQAGEKYAADVITKGVF